MRMFFFAHSVSPRGVPAAPDPRGPGAASCCRCALQIRLHEPRHDGSLSEKRDAAQDEGWQREERGDRDNHDESLLCRCYGLAEKPRRSKSARVLQKCAS